MNQGEQIRNELNALLRKRILLLDGAMGTMIQARKLDEAAYRGKEFARHGKARDEYFDLLLEHDLHVRADHFGDRSEKIDGERFGGQLARLADLAS